jgi:23S rRNA (cytosine1962-C5)-methyltransferase
MSDSAPPRVILKPRKALPFFSRHPWVFAGAIASIQGEPQPGDEVGLYTHEGQFIAWGLFNPYSQIRVRLYSWDEAQRIDRSVWSRRLDEAFRLRLLMFPDADEKIACRLVFSEADGLSGLIVDQFGEWLLVQVTSLAISKRLDLFVDLLREKLNPRGIFLRTERGMTDQEQLDLQDGLLLGEAPPERLLVEDAGIRFSVDVMQGQKTGFYLDQRDNRAAAARYLPHDGKVLDAFCYSGGFGLSSVLRGRAESVLAIDTSESALDLARGNAELNGVADRFEFVRADVFDYLETLLEQQRSFDAVFLDPPKLARTRKGLDRAMKGYFSLNRRVLDLMPEGGILVTCSCSGLVSRSDFEDMLAQVAIRSGRSLQILESRGQAPDHPVSALCFETQYLKCYICRVI